jgi:hypothetical protein
LIDAHLIGAPLPDLERGDEATVKLGFDGGVDDVASEIGQQDWVSAVGHKNAHLLDAP